MIEKTAFGSMTIDGRQYTSDLMILPDGRIRDQWRRESGHKLALPDIAVLIEQQPALIIVGMGVFGRMKPVAGLEEALAEQGIRLLSAWNKDAVEQFNQLAETGERLAACFHLTC